jgi:hypothetical protein
MNKFIWHVILQQLNQSLNLNLYPIIAVVIDDLY